MGMEIMEVQRAFGYAGAGALALKALDLLIKWRAGTHVEVLAELDAARKIGSELRDELRKRIEQLEREAVEKDMKIDALEKQAMTAESSLVIAENGRKDAEAELRLLRKASDASEERQQGSAALRAENKRRKK